MESKVKKGAPIIHIELFIKRDGLNEQAMQFLGDFLAAQLSSAHYMAVKTNLLDESAYEYDVKSKLYTSKSNKYLTIPKAQFN